MTPRTTTLLPIVAATLLAAATSAPAAQRVEITRTEYGIPHVKAATLYGGGLGTGYAYAQDNACLMLEEVVTLRGERSLYFGPETRVHDIFEMSNPDYTNVVSDVYYRYFMDQATVQAQQAGTDAGTDELVRGYVDGFNRYVRETGSAKLPDACRGKPWVRDITAEDIHRRTIQFGLRAGANFFASGIVAKPGQASALQSALPLMSKRVHPSVGSNVAAFGRDMTSNGRGLHASNPHFPWAGIERFYVHHMTVPGKLDVFGGALSGMPLPALGFTAGQAWSITWSVDQRFTLHELTLDPHDPTRYVLDGKTVPMTKRIIKVPVEGANGRHREETVHETVFGPILASPLLPWSRQTAYAVADINRENHRLLNQLHSIGRANSVAAVRSAVLTDMGLPYSNVVAADSDGRVLYINGSVTPNIPNDLIDQCVTSKLGKQWLTDRNWFVLDGTRSACRAQPSHGAPQRLIIPPDRRPVLERNDYVVHSNDSHWVVNADPATRLTGFQRIIGIDVAALGERTRRALFLAEDRRNGRDGLPGNKIDADSFMKLYWRSPLVTGELVIADLLADCRARPQHRLADGSTFDLQPACEALAKWDRSDRPDSIASHLFNRFVKKMPQVQSTVGTLFPPRFWKQQFDPKDPLHTPAGFNVNDEVRNALAAAAQELTAAGVALDARLADVQFVERNGQRLSLSGGYIGYNNLDATLQKGKGLTEPVPFGNSYMHIVTYTDNGPVARGILSYAQAADPTAPHGSDMTRVYSQDRFIDLPFTATQVAAGKIGASTLLEAE
jgi:acyl-homoserine-lactone acylase